MTPDLDGNLHSLHPRSGFCLLQKTLTHNSILLCSFICTVSLYISHLQGLLTALKSFIHSLYFINCLCAPTGVGQQTQPCSDVPHPFLQYVYTSSRWLLSNWLTARCILHIARQKVKQLKRRALANISLRFYGELLNHPHLNHCNIQQSFYNSS